MLRSIIPFVLVCLGITLVALARDMPLFDWEISEIVVDIPPGFDVKPSPWTTRLGETVLGEAFDDGGYFLWQVYTSMGNSTDVCSPLGPKPIAKLSQNDELLERISINFYQKVFSWSAHWSIVGLILFLSGVYIWWFTIWYKHPISRAVIFTGIVTMMFCLLQVSIWRILAGRVMPALPCTLFLPAHPYSGTITFNANLSKIHYEMLIVLFTGVCFELGAIGVMLRQMMRAIMQRKESAQSAVG
jgi:hypothetical protein